MTILQNWGLTENALKLAGVTVVLKNYWGLIKKLMRLP